MEKTDAEKWFYSIINSVDGKAAELKNDTAKMIENQMNKKSMHKKDLAEKLGRSTVYVEKLLRGDQDLTIQSLVEIADAVDLDVKITMTDTTDQPKTTAR